MKYLLLFLTACASAPELDSVRDELEAANASMVTALAQAQGLSTDTVALHDAILSNGLETTASAAAFADAQEQIADLAHLYEDAKNELDLPEDYSPPEVTSALTSTPADAAAAAYTRGLSIDDLFDGVRKATLAVNNKILELTKDKDRHLSTREMFEIQLAMNQLSMMSELASAMLTAMNSGISRMAATITR